MLARFRPLLGAAAAGVSSALFAGCESREASTARPRAFCAFADPHLGRSRSTPSTPSSSSSGCDSCASVRRQESSVLPPSPSSAPSQPSAPSPPPAPFTPTADYVVLELEGWEVFVHPALLGGGAGGSGGRQTAKKAAVAAEDEEGGEEEEGKEEEGGEAETGGRGEDDPPGLAELGAEAVRVLQWQLYLASRTVGEPQLAALRRVPIWLELPGAASAGAGAEYHWGPEWLVAHGRNPDKARSIEFTDARSLVHWGVSHLPTMVLHELAHAYHDHVLGEHHGPIEAAYEEAVASGRYAAVLRISGGPDEEHYGCTNKFEYFACASAAYFGQSDYFPFVNAEMARHDPRCHALMTEIWGVPRRGASFERGEERERRAKRTLVSLVQGSPPWPSSRG